jgi:hypothetical protein
MSAYASPALSGSPLAQLLDSLRRRLARLAADRAAQLGLFVLGALVAFELFNYSTTEFALGDLLGGLELGGLRWATILALAFSAMDFAGIAWLFTPRPLGGGLHSWYLLGAWFLAASMNAALTWWSVSLALVSHQPLGDLLIGREPLLRGVPIFVAALVWLLRILLIGSFTLRAPSSATPGRPARRMLRPPAGAGRGIEGGRRLPARLIPRPRAGAPTATSPDDDHDRRAQSR